MRASRDTSRGPLTPPPSPSTSASTTAIPSALSGSSKRRKGKSKRIQRSSSRSQSPSMRSGGGSCSSGESSSGEGRPSSSHGCSHFAGSGLDRDTPWTTNANTATRLKDGDRGWDARRRDPRANGADIYVARFTKNGMGSAKPCWRCIEWCRWAGVKRIFHWDADEGRFVVVKVNDAQSGQYETHADIRLFAGLVRLLTLAISISH